MPLRKRRGRRFVCPRDRFAAAKGVDHGKIHHRRRAPALRRSGNPVRQERRAPAIHKCPRIADVLNMVGILGELGCNTKFDGNDLVIDSADAANHEIPSSLAKELRSSVFMLGSVVSRFGRARIAYPGGCDIGLRPIDLHLNGLRRLGVCVSEGGGYIDCSCGKIEGAEVVLDFPSVGATERSSATPPRSRRSSICRISSTAWAEKSGAQARRRCASTESEN